MPEQLQNVINRIVEWWQKFTRGQKIILVSVLAGVIAAFSILAYVNTRPDMYLLRTAESAIEANEIKTLLDDNGIIYQLSQDGMSYYIDRKDEAKASVLLGVNGIPSNGYSLSDVIDGSFSTTEADKQKRYQLYLESRLEDHLETFDMVNSAQVTLNIPEDDGTLISKRQDSYARVILNLKAPMDDATAAGIAQYIATGLGNKTTENIIILDSQANVLFSGTNDNSVVGRANSNQTIRDKVKSNIESDVRAVLLQTNVYDSVEVGLNLDMNFDEKELVDYYYYIADGRDEGYLDSRSVSTTESTTGVGGVPGTTSNDDDTTYVVQDGEQTSSNTSDVYEDFLPNETITTTKKEVGITDMGNSSISVAATNYVMYNEDELKALGTITKDYSFDQFVADNSERIKTDVDPEFITLISKATGIPETSISMVAYEIPMFNYSEGGRLSVQDILQIILAVLIFAMLGFVVFRSLRSEEEEEAVEEEVTIEDLIEKTQDESLADIAINEKSEALLLIEKFVDEKPEAVASLLRNWLNEDWG